MKTKGKEITLRDYQYKSVELAFTKQRATVNGQVNSGKTGVAYAIIKYVQDLLSYSDSILFLVGNASVAVQTKKNFEEALDTEIGFWGSGKKDLQQITIGMPQTIHSALKDPAKDVKVTTRNKKLQYMATKYVPMFDKFVTKKPMIRNFLKTHKPKYSYDRECFDELIQMLSMPEQDVSNALYWYTEKWRKFVKKANKKKFKQHEQALDYLDSVKVVIADECLTEDALVTMYDGSLKNISDLVVGDLLLGNNKVKNTIVKPKQPTMLLRHKFGFLEGTYTHPVATLSKDNKIKYKFLMQITDKDKVLIPLPKYKDIAVVKDDDYYLAFLLGIIIADGTFLKYKLKSGDRASNTMRINVSKDFDWYKKYVNKGVDAFENKYGYRLPLETKLDSRGNLLLRITDPQIKKWLLNNQIPYGKKSSTVCIPKKMVNNDSEMLGCISGILSCESDLSIINNSNETNQRLSVSMCSQKLLQQINTWLISKGITSTLHQCRVAKGSRSSEYRMSITGESLNNIDKLLELIERKRPKRTGISHISKAIINGNNYIVSKVLSVDEQNLEKDTYDIETENHTFIANGILNHNCHMFAADTFKDVLNHLLNARMRIGMTGTLPTDNVKAHIFEGEFGTDKLSVTNEELISRGISTKPYICQVPIESPKNLDKKALGALPVGLPKSQLDLMLYQEVYRQGIVHNNYRNGVIANLANKVYNSNSQGVVLIVVKSIEHGNIIEEEINAINSDINVKYLQGQDTLDRRGEVLDQVKASKVDVLIATSVIDVGVDLPNLQYLVYASGGKSPIQLLQRIGRMLRLGKHKPYIVVYDFVDRTSKYLYAQSQSREKIYDEQKFEFINRE